MCIEDAALVSRLHYARHFTLVLSTMLRWLQIQADADYCIYFLTGVQPSGWYIGEYLLRGGCVSDAHELLSRRSVLSGTHRHPYGDRAAAFSRSSEAQLLSKLASFS